MCADLIPTQLCTWVTHLWNSQSHRQVSQCLWPIILSESLSCTLACADGLNVCIAQLYINYYLCNVHTKSYHQTYTDDQQRPLDVYIHHHCTSLLQDIQSGSKIHRLCTVSITITVLHHRLRPKHLTWVLSQWLWLSKTVRHSAEIAQNRCHQFQLYNMKRAFHHVKRRFV